jgi:hypothetical protein
MSRMRSDLGMVRSTLRQFPFRIRLGCIGAGDCVAYLSDRLLCGVDRGWLASLSIIKQVLPYCSRAVSTCALHSTY